VSQGFAETQTVSTSLDAVPPGLRTRRLLTLLAALVFPPALLMLYRVEPTTGGWYPPCLLHLATGLHCPGCGTTRGLHALLHGDWRQALAYNAMLLLLVPTALWSGLRYAVAALAGRPAPVFRPARWIVVILIALVFTFGIVRNLPFAPANWLAPHRLDEDKGTR
jgi:hypothetical protein